MCQICSRFCCKARFSNSTVMFTIERGSNTSNPSGPGKMCTPAQIKSDLHRNLMLLGLVTGCAGSSWCGPRPLWRSGDHCSPSRRANTCNGRPAPGLGVSPHACCRDGCSQPPKCELLQRECRALQFKSERVGPCKYNGFSKSSRRVVLGEAGPGPYSVPMQQW